MMKLSIGDVEKAEKPILHTRSADDSLLAVQSPAMGNSMEMPSD